MKPDTDITHLHPDLLPIAVKCLSEWLSTYPERRPAKITQTWRSAAYQQHLFNIGASEIPAGKSLHEFTLPDGTPAAKAFDWALFDEDGNYIEDGTDDWYADFAAIGKQHGLRWGGDYKHAKPDWDHLELPS